MAGYVMTIDNIESLKECFSTGIYSTRFKSLKYRSWSVAHEGAFADYLSMKKSDSIFFFAKRKIYGIGRIVEIKSDCRVLNYIGADDPINYSKIEYSEKGGEVRHLTFEDRVYGPEFEPLAEVIARKNLTPVIICESAGTQGIDALYMKSCAERAGVKV